MASVQLPVILHKDYSTIRKNFSMIIKIKDFKIDEITSSRLNLSSWKARRDLWLFKDFRARGKIPTEKYSRRMTLFEIPYGRK